MLTQNVIYLELRHFSYIKINLYSYVWKTKTSYPVKGCQHSLVWTILLLKWSKFSFKKCVCSLRATLWQVTTNSLMGKKAEWWKCQSLYRRNPSSTIHGSSEETKYLLIPIQKSPKVKLPFMFSTLNMVIIELKKKKKKSTVLL